MSANDKLTLHSTVHRSIRSSQCQSRPIHIAKHRNKQHNLQKVKIREVKRHDSQWTGETSTYNVESECHTRRAVIQADKKAVKIAVEFAEMGLWDARLDLSQGREGKPCQEGSRLRNNVVVVGIVLQFSISQGQLLSFQIGLEKLLLVRQHLFLPVREDSTSGANRVLKGRWR